MSALLAFAAGPIGRWLVIGLLVASAVATFYLTAYNAGYSNRDAIAVKDTADANARARKAEQQHRDKMAALALNYHREEIHAQDENNRLRADLRSGARRLSIAIRSRSSTCADPAPAAATEPEARADIDPAAAAALIALTDEGDSAIRQSNALIDAYELARKTCGQ